MSHVFENPLLWKDVDTFNPDRFREEGAKIPFQFQPFGFAGGRICPGKTLAQFEIAAAIGTLFKNFDVKLHNEKPLKMRKLTANSIGEEIYGTLHFREQPKI